MGSALLHLRPRLVKTKQMKEYYQCSLQIEKDDILWSSSWEGFMMNRNTGLCSNISRSAWTSSNTSGFRLSVHQLSVPKNSLFFMDMVVVSKSRTFVAPFDLVLLCKSFNSLCLIFNFICLSLRLNQEQKYLYFVSLFVLLVTRSAYALQLPALDTLAIPQDSNGECRWMLKAFNLPIVVIALGLPSPISCILMEHTRLHLKTTILLLSF